MSYVIPEGYRVKTGDLILHKGQSSGKSDIIIRGVTKSDFTHVGIAVKIKGVMYLLEATVQYKDDAQPDYLSGKNKKSGVMLVNLEKRIKTYIGPMFVRPLNRVWVEGKSKLWNLYKKYYKNGFEQSKWEMLNAQLKWGMDSKSSLRELFCSEFIAQILIEVGWLSPRKSSKFYVPREFATLQIKSPEKKYFYLNKLIRI